MSFVPNTPPEYCGRETEIRKLVSFVTTRPVIVIAGIGGMGKTALAASLADEINKGTFKEKIVWVTCNPGITLKSLIGEISQVLSEKITDKTLLNPGLSAPELLKLLEAWEGVLFIDDIHNLNEDASILLGDGASTLEKARLIVTTRQRIPGTDAYELHVSGLSREATDRLISGILEKQGVKIPNRVSLDSVYNTIKGHPFSLKLFASLLAFGGYSAESLMDSSEFSDQLSQHLLDKLWEMLSKHEKKALFRLSVLRIPTPAEYLHVYCSENPSEIINALSGKYMLDNTESGVSIHSLLKEYTVSKCSVDTIEALHVDAARYYSSSRVNQVYLKKEAYFHFQQAGQPEKAIDALLSILTELPVLGKELETFYSMVESGLESGNGYRYQDLTRAKIDFLTHWRRFSDAEDVLDALDGENETEMLSARIAFDRTIQEGHDTIRFSEAVDTLETALEKCLDPGERIEILSCLAMSNFYLGDFTRSEELFENSIQEAKVHNLARLQASSCFYYARFLLFTESYEQALKYLKTAEKIYNKAMALHPLSNTLYHMAQCYCALMENTKAKELIEQSISIKEKIGYRHKLASDRSLLGEIHLLQGNFEKALTEKKQALELSIRHNNEFLQARLNTDLGRILTMKGESEDARFNFRSALAIAAKYEDPSHKAYCLSYFIHFLVSMEETEQALDLLHDLEKHCETLGPEIKSRLYFLNSRAFRQTGRIEDAESEEEKLEIHLGRIYGPVVQRLRQDFDWLDNRLEKLAQLNYRIITRDNNERVDREEVRKIRKQALNYEFFADFSAKKLFIKGQPVDIFKKKLLLSLLIELCRIPGKQLKHSYLCKKVWKRDYRAESDAPLMRKGISRLRSLLSDKEEKLICTSLDTGSYFFNTKSDFCIIQKIKIIK